MSATKTYILKYYHKKFSVKHLLQRELIFHMTVLFFSKQKDNHQGSFLLLVLFSFMIRTTVSILSIVMNCFQCLACHCCCWQLAFSYQSSLCWTEISIFSFLCSADIYSQQTLMSLDGVFCVRKHFQRNNRNSQPIKAKNWQNWK